MKPGDNSNKMRMQFKMREKVLLAPIAFTLKHKCSMISGKSSTYATRTHTVNVKPK